MPESGLAQLIGSRFSRAACSKGTHVLAHLPGLAATPAGTGVWGAGARSHALLKSGSPGRSRAAIGVLPTGAGAMLPRSGEVSVMKYEELKEALRLITKVQNNPRVGPGRGDELQRAKRELRAIARSGKLDRQRVFRAVEIVAKVLQEIVEDDAT